MYNNYGYDNNKKISYSDSYEDMKTYSTYPTKDKKYVCQTGQFQGFYVESVEFCELKLPKAQQAHKVFLAYLVLLDPKAHWSQRIKLHKFSCSIR